MQFFCRNIIFISSIFLLMLVSCNEDKSFSTSITLSAKDKNPYGAFVFYSSLRQLFDSASFVSVNKRSEITDLAKNKFNNNIFISLNTDFSPSSTAWSNMLKFLDNGNTIFLSTFNVSRDVLYDLESSVSNSSISTNAYALDINDSATNMQIKLKNPPFAINQFSYPGYKLYNSIDITSTKPFLLLGTIEKELPFFVQFKIGKGNLFLHLSPLSFSNYFLLYHDNYRYLEQVFSYVSSNKTVNNVFIDDIVYKSDRSSNRNAKNEKKSNWLSKIMNERGFGAGILLAMALIIIYLLIQLQRKQKIIPEYKLPVNDSLEFVKTIGLLYFDKRDDVNLAQKISTYFLEHIRMRYKIFAKQLNQDFIAELSNKSGVDEVLIEKIIVQINRLHSANEILETELVVFRNDIEEFYKKEQ